MQCMAATQTGERCPNRAPAGMAFCGMHQPMMAAPTAALDRRIVLLAGSLGMFYLVVLSIIIISGGNLETKVSMAGVLTTAAGLVLSVAERVLLKKSPPQVPQPWQAASHLAEPYGLVQQDATLMRGDARHATGPGPPPPHHLAGPPGNNAHAYQGTYPAGYPSEFSPRDDRWTNAEPPPAAYGRDAPGREGPARPIRYDAGQQHGLPPTIEQGIAASTAPRFRLRFFLFMLVVFFGIAFVVEFCVGFVFGFTQALVSWELPTVLLMVALVITKCAANFLGGIICGRKAPSLHYTYAALGCVGATLVGAALTVALLLGMTGLTVAELHEQGIIDLDLMLLFWLPYIACAMLGVRYHFRRAARRASATGAAGDEALVVAELVEASTARPPGRIAPRRRTQANRR